MKINLKFYKRDQVNYLYLTLLSKLFLPALITIMKQNRYKYRHAIKYIINIYFTVELELPDIQC